MMDVLQSSYFAHTPYQERRNWILGDLPIRQREERVLGDLFTYIDSLPENSRVIEVGCGEGINLQLIQERYPSYQLACVGYDACQEAIASGQLAGMSLYLCDAANLPEDDAAADLVFCRDLLHHLPNEDVRKRVIAEMSRVTKPGGMVCIIEPNILHPLIFLQQIFQPAERGVRKIHEEAMIAILPTKALVHRREPSLLWRVIGHYRSPSFVREYMRSPFIQRALSYWERMLEGVIPSVFWGYKVYIWKRSVRSV